MTNRITRGVDSFVSYFVFAVNLPTKGAYFVAILLLLVAYAIHDVQVREYHTQAMQAKSDLSNIVEQDMKKGPAPQTEQPVGSKQGC